jgi:hypothetical protein
MRMEMTKSKWFLPLFAFALAVAMAAAEWIGGNPLAGLYSAAVIVGFGLVVLIAGAKSETVRGLRGDGRDERFRMFDAIATAFAGSVLLGVCIVLWMVEVARGRDGNPYGWLAAIGGLSYLVGIAFLRWRR